MIESRNNKTDVYNLGSGGSVTINWLVKKMQEIVGIQFGIQYAPKRPKHSFNRVAIERRCEYERFF